MISGKQLKKILDYSFTSGSLFVAPTSTFTVSPATYTTSALPASVVLSGAITVNDGTITGWTITDGSGTLLNSGTGLSPTVTLDGTGALVIPSTIGAYSYTLTVNYTDNLSAAQTLVYPLSISVTSASLYGFSSTNTSGGGLTAPIEATLTTSNQATIINLFSIVTTGVADHIIIVVPDSYGTIGDISDENDASVIGEFDVYIDAVNSRTVYTKTSTVTPSTYQYKVVFA